jgi:hypothetical protein
MKKFIDFFELNKPYEFDITDVTSIIYTICAFGIMIGYNMNILFFIGSLISTLFCWKARRLNLILLNGSLLLLNLYNIILMFIP